MESAEIIGGRYRLEEPIGRGGMATIFKAVDEQMMDRLVAVKVLREVYSNDPKFVTRFQREARAASALQHPNIVQVFDYGQSADSYYIVMEYIDGMDLRRYLKRRGGILPIERSVEIARAVAQGLGAAHRRGIVIYEMTTGQTPFDGDTPVAVAMKHIQEEPEPPSAINPRIPPALERIILKCLSKDPAARFRDGDELAATLTNFLRAPMRRNSGPEAVPGRGYSGNGYDNAGPRAGGRASGPRPDVYAGGGYGAPSPNSGPRGGAYPPMAVTGRPAQYSGFDDPTYDGPQQLGGREFGGPPIAAPTRPWEAAGGTQPRIGAPWRQGEEPEPRRNTGLIAAIIGAVAVVLLVGCILALALTGNLPGVGGSPTAQATSTTVPQVVVPDFLTTPITCTEAQTEADAKGLKATCVAKADTHTKDQVIAQSLPANSSQPKGSPITLTFSSGPAAITVPNVIGQPFNTASDTLTQDGLSVIVVPITSAKYDSGYVVKTDPAANATIQPTSDPASTQIKVYVSTGPAPTATPSPTATATATATGAPSPAPTTTGG